MKQISKKFKKALREAPTILTLLTIDHPDLSTPIRVVDWHEPVESRGEKFLPFAFTVEILQEVLGGEITISWDELPITIKYNTLIKVMAKAIILGDLDEAVLIFQQLEMLVQGNKARGNLPLPLPPFPEK